MRKGTVRSRALLAVSVGLALLVPMLGAAPAAADDGPPADEPPGASDVDAREAGESAPDVTYGYEIDTRGQVHADPAAFASSVAAILGDARGWTLGGSVAFERVGSGGDLNIILASPLEVENAAPVCHRDWSCRVGDDVLVNDDNWRQATTAWREGGGGIEGYRQYLISHEVGHFLGFGHFDCQGAGQPAPVMRQQSIDLQGCEPNGWPVDFERDALADRLGVAVHPWTFNDVLVHHVHRDTVDAVAGADIALGYEDGTFRPDRQVTRPQMATFLTRALGLEAAGEPPFDDVPAGHPHAEGIAAVAEAEIALGFEDGTFGIGETVTRGQMAAFLARAYDLEAESEPAFADIGPGHVHAESIAAVAEAEIALGFEDGTFRAGHRVERGQMASFLARAHPDL